MKLFAPYREKIKTSIHFNLAEGHCLSKPSQVSWLVDERGMFSISFFKVLLLSFTRKKKELKKQIKTEMQAQLVRMLPYVDTLRIDSHQHYHMIPIVLDSLLEVLSEQEFEHLRIRQIRIPCDPVSPLVHTQGMPKRVPVMNLVKWCILKIYAGRSQVLLKSRGIQSPVFFGIFFTCEMKWEVVKTLLPAYQSYAGRKASELELMFHPGNLTAAYELLDARNKELADFYMSDNRFYEAECLKLLGVNSKDT